MLAGVEFHTMSRAMKLSVCDCCSNVCILCVLTIFVEGGRYRKGWKRGGVHAEDALGLPECLTIYLGAVMSASLR